MMILIMGRTGSGKNTAAAMLKNMIKNATNLKLTETHFNNGVFEDETANICIVSPDQLSEIIAHYTHMMFIVVYMKATSDDDRKFNYIRKMITNTPSDKELLLRYEREFDDMDEKEDASFCQFEEKYYNEDSDSINLPLNIHMIQLVENDYSQSSLLQKLIYVCHQYLLYKKLVPVIKEAADLGIILWANNAKSEIKIQKVDGQSYNIPLESMACFFIEKPSELGHLMLNYIQLSKRFSDLT